jgi:glycosyltransferase involved in cell wall biosynthesis
VTSILFVHPSDELYGADRVLLEVIASVPPDWEKEVWLPDDIEYEQRHLSSELRRRGISVRVVALPILRRAHLRITYLPTLLRNLRSTRRLLLQKRPQIVYLNTAATLLCRVMCHRSRTAVIVHLHEYLRGIEGILLRILMLGATEIIVVSQSVRARLGRWLHDVSRLIYNGFDIQPPHRALRPKELTFVLASRWNAWKGHASLLRAWSNVERDDVRLMLLGAPPPSGAATDVQAIVETMPNRESVEIVGQVDNVLNTLSDSDVLLVPSTMPDPLPTVAIEAMGVGVAVMASNCGGLREIVVDGETGWLLPAEDESAWTAAIESVTREQAMHFGRNGRRRYEAMFDGIRYRHEVRSALEEAAP